jgi:hypothetical protein
MYKNPQLEVALALAVLRYYEYIGSVYGPASGDYKSWNKRAFPKYDKIEVLNNNGWLNNSCGKIALKLIYTIS